MRICIVRLSALGDIVMCLPLLRTLQAMGAEVTWVTSKPYSTLLPCMVDTLPTQSFDILLATQASLKANILYPRIRAARKIGYDSIRSRDGHQFFVSEHIPFREEHTVEGFLSFARHIGAEKMIYDGRLPVTCESPIQGDYCVIHPYSSRKEKDWPYERYHPIKEAIEKRGLRVVMTGTPFFKTTLPEFIALLSKAKFLISPDTGPMHIASGFGVPTIALFAPTSPLLTGPYFTQDYVINKHPEVLATYQPRRQWNVRVYEKGAMALISVDDVLQKVESLLEQQRP